MKDDRISRRKYLGGTAAAVTGAAAASGEAAGHYIWLPAYSNTALNARTGPGLGYGVIATVGKHTGGFVIDGPVDADGYTWWKYWWNGDGNNGRFEGWSAGVDQWTNHANMCYPATGYCSSNYYSNRSYGDHQAIDIANAKYTNVHAGREGYHTTHWGSGCGNYSVVDHGSGYETLYCHANSFVAGNGVNVGHNQHIQEMGTTGNSTGDHCHFEVNLNGDEDYVAGGVGEEFWKHTGVPVNYGLSWF